MIVLGLSHRTAPLEVREKLAIAPRDLSAFVSRLGSLGAVSEVVVLATCNRVEVYAEGVANSTGAAVIEAIANQLCEMGGPQIMPHLVSHEGSNAIKHLFRVAASLDSLVVGEAQILGQLKQAVRASLDAERIGPILSSTMRAAFHTAKRVRSETAIGAGQVSIPSVAIDLARHIFDSLEGKQALLVGAGAMGLSAAKLLAQGGASVSVVNRSSVRAAEVARAVGGRSATWKKLDEELVAADIIVTSTSAPGYIIDAKQLKRVQRKRRERSLFVIDIAVPRDVDPKINNLEHVYLYDVDDLSHVVAQSLQDRAQEAAKGEQIVRKECRLFERRQSQLALKPTIVAMRQHAKTAMQHELERTLRGRLKHLGETEREALSVMIDAATKKLLHLPITRLRDIQDATHQGSAVSMLSYLYGFEDPPDSDAPRLSADDLDAATDDLALEVAPAAEDGDDAGDEVGSSQPIPV